MNKMEITKKDPYSEVKKELVAAGTQEEQKGQEGFFYWSRKIVLLSLPDDAALPPDLVNFSAAPYGLTLLHVAALSANKIAFIKLLNCGANPNACDRRGWTAAHHLAFLGIRDLAEFTTALRGKGADFSIKNDLHATADKLYKLTSPQIALLVPCYWLDRIDSPLKQQFDHKQYSRRTNSLYITENFIDPCYLVENWRRPKEAVQGQFPFTQEIAGQYAAYKRSPPKHTLAPVSTDSSGAKLPVSPGLGLYSDGTFPARRIVGEYVGKLSKDNTEGAYTTIGGWDAEEYSSPATRINSSFPNVAMMRLPADDGIEGLPYRIVFVSLDEVSGQFCWNYGGHHPLKFGPYVEQRPKEMRDFIRNNDTNRLVASLLQEIGDRCQDWQTYAESEKLRYIIQTPSALFLLTLEGVLPAEASQKLLGVAFMCSLLSENKDSSRCVAVAAALRGLCQKFACSASEISADVEKFFQRLSARLSLADLLDTAESTTKRLARCDSPAEAWEKIKSELKERCNDPEEDIETDNLDKNAEEILTSIFGRNFRVPPDFIAAPSAPPAFSQNSSIPRLFGHNSRCDKQYAVGGIGRKLNESDIGKNFVRTFPREISHGHYDWSYVPTLGYMHHGIKTLVKMEGERIWMKSANKPSDRLSKMDKEYLDNNWIEADRYEEALKAVLDKASPEQKAHVLDYEYNDSQFRRTTIGMNKNNHPSSIPKPSGGKKYSWEGSGASAKPFSFSNAAEDMAADMNSIFSALLKAKAANEQKAAEALLASQLSVKDTVWEKNKEAWWEEFLKKLPADPATRDYSQFKAVDSGKAAKSQLPAAPPQFDAADPRAVLGLQDGEEDIVVIEKQYRKLALRYHPDKGGDEEIFKKIAQAHKTLLEELRPALFRADLARSEEDNYLLATPYFLQLLEKKGKTEELIGEWEGFVQELKTLEKHPKKEADSAL